MNEFLQSDIAELAKYVPNFLVILLRTSLFVSLIPIIGSKQIPMQFRLGIAVVISLLLTPTLNIQITEDHIPMLIVREIFFGLTLGFSVRVIFLGINMAGLFISHMIGMSIATAINPEMGQSTQIAEAYGIIAMLFFLVMDIHHDLIYVFVKSFEILPAGGVQILPVIPVVLAMGGKLFLLAIKISAPIIVCLLMVHILAGFLYKAAPQINIFFITMPLNIFIGFVLIIMCIPVLEYVLGIEFNNIRDEMTRLIFLAKG